MVPLIQGRLYRWIDVNGGNAAAVDHLKEEIAGVTGKAQHDVVIAGPVTQINNPRPIGVALEVDPGFEG